MSITLDVYLLLREIGNLYNVPYEVSVYLVKKFYEPLAQAGRELEKIDRVFDLFRKSVTEKFSSNKDVEGINEYMPELYCHDRKPEPADYRVCELLNDTSILLDVRIDDGRLEKYVQIVAQPWLFPYLPNLAALDVLEKGLMMDIYSAASGAIENDVFHLLTERFAFIQRLAKKLLVEPLLEIDETLLHNLTYFCLENQMEETFLVLYYDGCKIRTATSPAYHPEIYFTPTRQFKLHSLLSNTVDRLSKVIAKMQE